jgi:uncharacterized protein
MAELAEVEWRRDDNLQAGETTMLELRPICENCAKALPPESTDARICSHECTFCAACVDGILANVCPNCGGGFEKRPIRPQKNWKGDNDVGHHPPVTVRKHRPVDETAHAAFSGGIKDISPSKR